MNQMTDLWVCFPTTLAILSQDVCFLLHVSVIQEVHTLYVRVWSMPCVNYVTHYLVSVCSLLHLLYFCDHFTHEQEMQKRPNREFLKLKPKITQLNSHSEKYWCLKKIIKVLLSQSTLNPLMYTPHVIFQLLFFEVLLMYVLYLQVLLIVLFFLQLTGIRQSQIDGQPHLTEVLDKVWLAQSQVASIV